RALADEDLMEAPVDAHAMLEVDHVVAQLEGGDGLDRGGGAVAAGAAEPPLAPDDLVVGEHAQPALLVRRREQEAAVEYAHGERRVHAPATLGEELFQPLRLAGVVAQDDRRHTVAGQAAKAAHVTVDGL